MLDNTKIYKSKETLILDQVFEMQNTIDQRQH